MGSIAWETDHQQWRGDSLKWMEVKKLRKKTYFMLTLSVGFWKVSPYIASYQEFVTLLMGSISWETDHDQGRDDSLN